MVRKNSGATVFQVGKYQAGWDRTEWRGQRQIVLPTFLKRKSTVFIASESVTLR